MTRMIKMPLSYRKQAILLELITRKTRQSMEIDINKFMKGKGPKPTVCYPLDIEGDCELWGYHHDESNYYNVIATSKPNPEIGGAAPMLLGRFYAQKPPAPQVFPRAIRRQSR